MSYVPDRSQYPAKKADGTLDIDLASGKYLKLWQGPNHPGITGNMSVELTVCGAEVGLALALWRNWPWAARMSWYCWT